MKSSVLLFLMLCLTSLTFAQNFDPPLPPDEQIPIDGGISLLLAAGAIWGVKKLKDKN